MNLIGNMLLSQAVVARMIEAGIGGAIVNVASIAGIVPHGDDMIAYGASKAGVINATRTLAKALAPHGIRVNVVLPAGSTRRGFRRHPAGKARTSRSATAPTRTKSRPRSCSSPRRSPAT